MAMLSRIVCRFSSSLRSQSFNRTLNRLYHYKPKQKDAFYDVEGVVTKDMILFRYEDVDKMKKGQYLALAMVPIFSFMGYTAYSLKSSLEPFKDDVDKNERINFLLNNVLRASVGVGLGFFLGGISLASYWTLRTLYTVRRLMLRKGGKYVSIQTYGILGNPTGYANVPVTHCSAVQQKLYGKQRFFLKVKDHSFKYQFNVEDGVFSNRPMFDRTVGISRRI